MKKIIVSLLLAVIFLYGCQQNNFDMEEKQPFIEISLKS